MILQGTTDKNAAAICEISRRSYQPKIEIWQFDEARLTTKWKAERDDGMIRLDFRCSLVSIVKYVPSREVEERGPFPNSPFPELLSLTDPFTSSFPELLSRTLFPNSSFAELLSRTVAGNRAYGMIESKLKAKNCRTAVSTSMVGFRQQRVAAKHRATRSSIWLLHFCLYTYRTDETHSGRNWSCSLLKEF